MVELAIGDHSLQVELDLRVSVVTDLVVTLDVLGNGLTARASSVLEGNDSSSDHVSVLGVLSGLGWLLGLGSGLHWSRHIDSQSMSGES